MNSKKKFNVVDVIIILIVLLVAGVSVYRAYYQNKSRAITEEKNITYTITASNIDNIYADSLEIGDVIYIADKKLMCGTVTDVKAEYMIKSEAITDTNGEAVTVTGIDPSIIKLYVTVNTSGHFADSMLYLGSNTYLSEGQRIVFYNEIFTFDGIVSDFTQ